MNPIAAHLWRCETLRLPLLNSGSFKHVLMNDHYALPLDNTPISGLCDKQTLESATEQFASWVLQGPLRLLANEITDAKEIDKRHKDLVSLLTTAAELATKLFCEDRYFILHGLEKSGLHKNIIEIWFRVSTTLMAHSSHGLGYKDDRLDGRPPVILIQPALIARRGGNSDPRLSNAEVIIRPGLALIEDREAN